MLWTLITPQDSNRKSKPMFSKKSQKSQMNKNISTGMAKHPYRSDQVGGRWIWCLSDLVYVSY